MNLMKKTILFPLLLSLLATSAHSDIPLPASGDTEKNNNALTSTPPAPSAQKPASEQVQPIEQAAAPIAIDCNFHIPASQKTIDTATITTWGEKAALQSFSFSSADMQNQLNALQHCYTEQGWKSFNEALQKSGNLDSIKSQLLNVSAQKDGEISTNSIKDNQWKITLPIQAVYQNDKEKITQKLNVSVLIGRKSNGDLGIMQMIATTRPAAAPTQPTPSENSATTTPGTPPAENQAPVTPKTTPQPVQ